MKENERMEKKWENRSRPNKRRRIRILTQDMDILIEGRMDRWLEDEWRDD